MSFLGRLFGLGSESSSPEIPGPIGPSGEYRLTMFEPRDRRGRGLVVERISDGQRLAWDTLFLNEPGMVAFGVAGERYRLEALQHEAFAPGKSLALIPEPDNPHDPNAVAVWDADQRLQVGYVPRDMARDFGARIRSGERLRCLSMWEVRDESGRRVALRALLLDETMVPGSVES